MAQILLVGIATIDIINYVDSYPQENTEIRLRKQQTRRGGNAANSAVILSQMGHQCSWAGALCNDAGGGFIKNDLHQHDINIQHSCGFDAGKTPTSYITLNINNGSRTILHYRDLPEYSFEYFKCIDLSVFDWLHFEGRNCQETVRMVQLARSRQPQLPISIEIEKHRPDIDALFEWPDLLLFSRSYAQYQGFKNGEDFLLSIRKAGVKAVLFCAWGEVGAWALNKTGSDDKQVAYCPAFPPLQLIDTLAAGDTFNAAVIDSFCASVNIHQALRAGCQLAGRKCGVEGLDFLNECTKYYDSNI